MTLVLAVLNFLKVPIFTFFLQTQQCLISCFCFDKQGKTFTVVMSADLMIRLMFDMQSNEFSYVHLNENYNQRMAAGLLMAMDEEEVAAAMKKHDSDGGGVLDIDEIRELVKDLNSEQIERHNALSLEVKTKLSIKIEKEEKSAAAKAVQMHDLDAALSGALGFTKGMGGAMTSGVKGIGGTMASGVKGIGGTMTSGVKGIGGTMTSGVKGMGGAMTSGVKGMSGTMTSGVKGMGGTMTSGVKGMSGAMASGAKRLSKKDETKEDKQEAEMLAVV